MDWYLIFLVWLLGLCFGSFANVCIYRGIKNESILGRSYCPICQTQLRFFDLIPLISWICSRGNCRYCKLKISWQYPLIELICATTWAVIYIHTENIFGLAWLLYSLIAIVFIIIAGMDFLDKENGVDDRYILVGTVLVVFLRIYLDEEISMLMGATAGFLLSGGTYLMGKILYVSQKDIITAYGEGDILVCILIGGLVGWKDFCEIYFSACVLAIVWIGIYSLITKKSGFLYMSPPFVPFLVFATVVVLTISKFIPNYIFPI